MRRFIRIAILSAIIIYGSLIGVFELSALTSPISSAYGIPYPAALLLVLIAMPLLWESMIANSFLRDETVGTEIGIVLHVLYLSYGVTLCLHRGLDACVPLFLLYWPFAALIRRGLEPLLLWSFRERP